SIILVGKIQLSSARCRRVRPLVKSVCKFPFSFFLLVKPWLALPITIYPTVLPEFGIASQTVRARGFRLKQYSIEPVGDWSRSCSQMTRRGGSQPVLEHAMSVLG